MHILNHLFDAFTLPYSPDLNEIEHYWFPIKNRVWKTEGTIENFRDRVDQAVRLVS